MISGAEVSELENVNELSARLTAIASPQRLRILAMLAGEKLHVSELARRVQMSRALLYMHLAKLEEAGYVVGDLQLSDDGKAMKFFEVLPFTLAVDITAVVAAVNADADDPTQEKRK